MASSTRSVESLPSCISFLDDDEGSGGRGAETRKSRSLPTPPIPISPPIIPPSNYFSVPTVFSPAETFKSSDCGDKVENGEEGRACSDFFQFQTKPAAFHEQQWSYQEPNTNPGHHAPVSSENHPSQPRAQMDDTNRVSAQGKIDDGYSWRKYGKKQVKGSENPRCYYRCNFPDCSTKKKVECNLDGQIVKVVYKGTRNHPMPQNTRRNSSSYSQSLEPTTGEASEHIHRGRASEISSASFGWDDGHESKEDGPDAKREKKEDEVASAAGNKAVREPRVVVQTTSDIDILDDGYRWRKYGQKAVKGNPNPRSYYKCTTVGCSVRKHVERASHNLRSVITTYEGKHNHDVPAPRRGGAVGRPPVESFHFATAELRPEPILGKYYGVETHRVSSG